MDIRLITPYGALFALTALPLLAIAVRRRRRLRAVREALRLPEPSLRSHLPLVLALVAVPALLGIAAAQPVVETTRTVPERTDAQAFVVVDVSRSMLAGAGASAPTRFDRAREIALGLRSAVPELPIGIASITDRALPHLFPTTDDAVFATTLERSLGIEQPPAGSYSSTVASNLNGLQVIPEKNYFPPRARKRVLVVLTDGETQPLEPGLARSFARRPKVETIFVHVWSAGERIYEAGVVEGGYRPDPRSGAALARAASLVGGRVIPESDAASIASAMLELVGEGETVDRERETGRLALMPYLTLLVLIPLGFVLLRRNVWIAGRPRIESRTAPAPRVSLAAAPVPTAAGVERAA